MKTVIIPEDSDRILSAAIGKFGEQHQIDKAIEEFAELIAELAKYDDAGDDDELTERMIDEIADASIMARQLALIFGKDAVRKKIEDTMLAIIADGWEAEHDDTPTEYLAKAISNLIRYRQRRRAHSYMVKIISDVTISLIALSKRFGYGVIRKQIEKKLERLERNMEADAE